ncbi:PilZ domain protein [Syntrophotalea carbinolica DSM 2380]|uniref:PilZ domain protein n=2 Tax=Syntrophotalea carbinolica TaxID=19 RepID=Q3A5K0_SYNC1|nr:PilZ domain protein [Syntrophotalea carbinolica DSM 2380]
MHGPTQLDVQILPSHWPFSSLDAHRCWDFHCERGIHFIQITAYPENLEHPRHMRFRIEGHRTHDHMRENLRVETDIYLAWWHARTNHPPHPQPQRTHVNLSCRGLSLCTAEPLNPDDIVTLQLILPGTTLEHLQCEAKVLRVGPTTKKGHQTALKIVHILPEDTEKISLFCLAEHFRNMQSKTRLMGLMLGDW